VGRGLDLRQDPRRVGLRGVHHRRVLADDRRLASLPIAALGPGDRRVGDGGVESATSRPRPRSADSSQRPRRSTQYLSIRYSERLAENSIVASVGSRGDCFDNGAAETTNGLYKTECVFGPDAPRPGTTSANSNLPPCPGCTGSTRTGSTATAMTCRPPSSKQRSMLPNKPPRPGLETNSPSLHQCRGSSVFVKPLFRRRWAWRVVVVHRRS